MLALPSSGGAIVPASAPTRASDSGLRPYQEREVDSVLSAFRRGQNSFTIAPCGSGKTVMMLEIVARIVGRGGKVLIVLPYQTLIRQFLQRAPRHGISDGAIAIVWGDQTTSGAIADARVIFAMEDSIASARAGSAFFANCKRLDAIFFDEAHGSLYGKAAKLLQQAFPGARLSAWSATPFRNDGRSVLDMRLGEGATWHVSEPISTPEAIAAGYLARARYFSIGPRLDGSPTKFDGTEIKEISDTAKYRRFSEIDLDDVVTTWQRMWPHGGLTLVYCPTIRALDEFCDVLDDHGVRWGSITGETPERERVKLFESFESGDISILASVGTLIYGLDCSALCGIGLSPTNSLPQHVQILGRITRRPEIAITPLWLDFVGNCAKLPNPPDIASWLDVPAPGIACEECGYINQRARKVLTCEHCGSAIDPGLPDESGPKESKEDREKREAIEDALQAGQDLIEVASRVLATPTPWRNYGPSLEGYRAALSTAVVQNRYLPGAAHAAFLREYSASWATSVAGWVNGEQLKGAIFGGASSPQARESYAQFLRNRGSDYSEPWSEALLFQEFGHGWGDDGVQLFNASLWRT